MREGETVVRPSKDLVALFLGYLPGPLDAFSNMIVFGVLSRLNRQHKNLLMIGQPCYSSDEETCASLLNSGAEGLILIPPAEPLRTRLIETGLPMVAVADQDPRMVSVAVDNAMGTFMLAEHLALRGHCCVMYRKDQHGHQSAIERFLAFEKAAKYLNMDVIETMPADDAGNLSAEEEAYLLGSASRRPSAVVSWNDLNIHPVMRYCRLHGLNVPRDVALAGFDGIIPPIEPARKLTSVHAPWLHVAEKSVDLLIQMMQGESVPQSTILPVDLILGDTT